MLLHRERGHASPCSLELPPSIIQIDNRRLHLVANGFSVGASPQRPQQAVGRRYVDPGLEQARYDQPQPLEAVDELILKIPDFRLSGPSLGEDMRLKSLSRQLKLLSKKGDFLSAHKHCSSITELLRIDHGVPARHVNASCDSVH